MGDRSAHDFYTGQEEALSTLKSLDPGGSGSHLLRKEWRRLVASQLKPWAKDRRTETRQFWSWLVDLATAEPSSLGYIEIEAGGVPTLVERYGKSGTASTQFLGHLEGWEKLEFLVIYRRTLGHRPVVGLQIPWATETLLAVAEASQLMQRRRHRPKGAAGGKWDVLPAADKYPPDEASLRVLIVEHARHPRVPVPTVRTQRECTEALTKILRYGGT